MWQVTCKIYNTDDRAAEAVTSSGTPKADMRNVLTCLCPTAASGEATTSAGSCARLSYVEPMLSSPEQLLFTHLAIVFLTKGSATLRRVEASHWLVVPVPSGTALQPAGTVAAGALPIPQHVPVCTGTLHTLARASAILCLSSFKTHGLTPPGPDELLEYNLYSWSDTPIYLLQIHLTLLTNLLQRCPFSKAPHCLQQ